MEPSPTCANVDPSWGRSTKRPLTTDEDHPIVKKICERESSSPPPPAPVPDIPPSPTPPLQTLSVRDRSHQQQLLTQLGFDARQRFCSVLQEYLKSETLKRSEELSTKLLEMLSKCTEEWPALFSPRRSLGRRRMTSELDDLSPDNEIKEFSDIWLDGLFCVSLTTYSQHLETLNKSANQLLTILLQSLQEGYPEVVESQIGRILTMLEKSLNVSFGKEPQATCLLFELGKGKGSSRSPAEEDDSIDGFSVHIASSDLLPAITCFIDAVSCTFPKAFSSAPRSLWNLNSVFEKLESLCPADAALKPSGENFLKLILKCGHLPLLSLTQLDSIANKIRDVLFKGTLFQRFDRLQTLLTLADFQVTRIGVEVADWIFMLNRKRECSQSAAINFTNFLTEKGYLPTSLTELPAQLEQLSQTYDEFGEQVVFHPLFAHVLKWLLEREILPEGEANTTFSKVHLIVGSVFPLWNKVLAEWQHIATRSDEEEEKSSTIPDFLHAAQYMFRLAEDVGKWCTRILPPEAAPQVIITFFEAGDFKNWIRVAIGALSYLRVSPEVEYKVYIELLETIRVCDSNKWFQFKLSPSITQSLLAVVGWVWVGQHGEHLYKSLESIQAFLRDPSSVSESLTARASSLSVLRLDVFRPWIHFVDAIYSGELNGILSSSSSWNPFLVREMLLAFGQVSWAVQHIGIKPIVEFLVNVVEKDSLWGRNGEICSLLAKGISSLPCLVSYNTRTFLPDLENLRNGCCICDHLHTVQGRTSVDPAQYQCMPLQVAFCEKILSLASPLLFRCDSLLAKIELTDLIRRCFNHLDRQQETAMHHATYILPFLQLAVKGHVQLAEKIFETFGIVMVTCAEERQLEMLNEIFSRLPQFVFRWGGKTGDSLLKTTSKILKSFAKFVSSEQPISPPDFASSVFKCMMLLLSRCAKSEPIAIARNVMDRYAAATSRKPHLLIYHNRHELAEVIVSTALTFFPIQGYSSGMSRDANLKGCTGFLMAAFLTLQFKAPAALQIRDHLLPVIIQSMIIKLNGNIPLMWLLLSFGRLLNCTQVKLLEDLFVHWFPRILIESKSASDLDNMLTFMKEHYRVDTKPLMRTHQEEIISKLLLLVPQVPAEKVEQCISFLATGEEKSLFGKCDLSMIVSVQEILYPGILGFLLQADARLHSELEDFHGRNDILHSIIQLLKIIDSELATFIHLKLYNTLVNLIGLVDGSLLLAALKVYSQRMKRSVIGPISVQILAVAVEINKQDSRQGERSGFASPFTDILSLLLVDNRVQTEPYLREMHFLEGTLGLPEHVLEFLDSFRSLRWIDYLDSIMEGVASKNILLRHQAILKLHTILQTAWSRVGVGWTGCNQMIANLINSLRQEADVDGEFKKITVEAIGRLGVNLCEAKGQGRSFTEEYASIRRAPHVQIMESTDISASVCLPILQNLVEMLRGTVNIFSYAQLMYLIQEALKDFRVRRVEECVVWSKLLASQREIISSLFNSKYVARNVEAELTLSAAMSPKDMDKDGKGLQTRNMMQRGESFDSWIRCWFSKLVSLIEMSPSTPPLCFFQKCVSVLCGENDKQTTENSLQLQSAIIPYVAMFATIRGKDGALHQIACEIKRVLEKGRTASGSADLTTTVQMRKVVFSIWDYLYRSSKLSKYKLGLLKYSPSYIKEQLLAEEPGPALTEQNLVAVDTLLHQISWHTLTKAAYDHQALYRACYYAEQEMLTLNDQVPFFLEAIYASLGDDAREIVADIIELRERVEREGAGGGDSSTEREIIKSIAQSRVKDTVRHLELLVTQDPETLLGHVSLAQAYLALDEPQKCSIFIKGKLASECNGTGQAWEQLLKASELECLVKLQSWDLLSQRIEKLEESRTVDQVISSENEIPVLVSKLQCGKFHHIYGIVQDLKDKLTTAILTLPNEEHANYHRYLIRLRSMEDIVDVAKVLQTSDSEGRFGLIKELLNRWWITDAQNNRNLHALHKTLLAVLRDAAAGQSKGHSLDMLNIRIRRYWYHDAIQAARLGDCEHTKVCMKQVEQYNMKCCAYQLQAACEHAYLVQINPRASTEDKFHAVPMLTDALKQYLPFDIRTVRSETVEEVVGRLSENEKMFCSRALRYQANLCAKEKLLEEDTITRILEVATQIQTSEKNFFTLAYYMSGRNFVPPSFEDPVLCRLNWQAAAVKCFAKSLQYGYEYVHQSLPSLLMIWYDAGQIGNVATGEDTEDTLSKKQANVIREMNISIANMTKTVPAHILMTAFAQLTSMMGTKEKGKWETLGEIILYVLRTCPQQAIWSMMCVEKSQDKVRAGRCNELYKQLVMERPDLKLVLTNYQAISTNLIELSRSNAGGRDEIQVDAKLLKLVQASEFSETVILPMEVFIRPRPERPFPPNLPTIVDIGKTASVMSSAVMPKRITLLGKNGQTYGLLCKPKDNLRLDNGVMNLLTIVNSHLVKINNSGMKESLPLIRTYSALPLDEEHGIIEWVPNVIPMMSALYQIYDSKQERYEDVRKLIRFHDTLEEKKRKFKEILLAKHKPVLAEWFTMQFLEYDSWFYARRLFTQSVALMSIIGFILGVGDRHLQNLLLDFKTGMIVHVDYSSVFNKGETLKWIERVPFRLTSNMIDAIGPVYFKGLFVRSCVRVLQMLREKKEIYLANLTPFLLCPPVEWIHQSAENENEKEKKGNRCVANKIAQKNYNLVNLRLIGRGRVLTKDTNTELSPIALVDYLIEQATLVDNLSQMYYGWKAYL